MLFDGFLGSFLDPKIGVIFRPPFFDPFLTPKKGPFKFGRFWPKIDIGGSKIARNPWVCSKKGGPKPAFWPKTGLLLMPVQNGRTRKSSPPQGENGHSSFEKALFWPFFCHFARQLMENTPFLPPFFRISAPESQKRAYFGPFLRSFLRLFLGIFFEYFMTPYF